MKLSAVDPGAPAESFPQRGTAKGLSATTLLLENSLLTLIL
jgi:hypothetical protein